MLQQNDEKSESKYLSLEKAATYLGLSKEYIRLQAKRGNIRGAKLKGWRFDPKDLDDWFQSHATGGIEKRDTKQWPSVDIRKVVSGTSISCTKENAYIEALGLKTKKQLNAITTR